MLKIYVLVFRPQGMWDLSFLTRDPTLTLCFGRWSLNHWTAREVPVISLSFYPLLSLFQNGLETYTNTYSHKCACIHTHTPTCPFSLFSGKDWQMIGIYIGIEIGLEDYTHINVQFSAVTQSCPTLCDPMNHSTPGLPVHHQLLEFTQTHVHWVGDAIQPSHPLSSPSPPAPNPSQHQILTSVISPWWDYRLFLFSSWAFLHFAVFLKWISIILWYNKKYIFGLHLQLPAQSS